MLASGNVGSVPRPMFASKTPNGAAVTGIPTPAATPPVSSEQKRFSPKANKVSEPIIPNVEDGDSPRALATDPQDLVDENALPDSALGDKNTQEEDGSDSEEREQDIYNSKVIACKLMNQNHLTMADDDPGSIENPEACVMCSG